MNTNCDRDLEIRFLINNNYKTAARVRWRQPAVFWMYVHEWKCKRARTYVFRAACACGVHRISVCVLLAIAA